MIIETYRSLKEKDNYFDSEYIESTKDFDELARYWTDIKDGPSRDSEHKIFFRGLTEAKFKLYNTAQRYWIENELYVENNDYKEFIQSEINNAKCFQANLLSKFYNSFKQTAQDLSVLSFLQHYGAPTPLLDFTYYFDSAIFFGTYKQKKFYVDEIDNYFSIYAIDTSNLSKFFPSVIDHINSSLSQIDSILEQNIDNEVNEFRFLHEYKQLHYKTFHDLKLFYIPGFIPDGYKFSLKHRPNFNLYFNQNNLNIINQAGLFVFNSDPIKPLESYFTGEFVVRRTYNLPKIKCWNIHKSLKGHALKYLKKGTFTTRDRPINSEFMFPKEEHLAKIAFQQAKKNLNFTK